MHWIRMGSILLFIGVALGAFGAHALKSKLSEYGLDIYKTAVLYHLIHALGILGIGILSLQWSSTNLNMVGTLLLLGIIFFSGSLYLLSITGIKWLGAITPLGGLCFLAAWANLCWLTIKLNQ